MFAVNARYSISVDYLLRNVTEQRPQIAALTNNLKDRAGKQRLFRFPYLIFGNGARKSLTDKLPHIIIATILIRKMKENCEQAFMKSCNRTLECYKSFARKQQENKTLRHFWHALTGMAAKCEYETRRRVS